MKKYVLDSREVNPLSNTKVILITMAIIVSVVLLLGLWAKWELWEPGEIKKGSLVYRLKVPDELKAFPTWGELTAPEYDISNGDGGKPSAARMKYTTSYTLEAFLDEAKKLQFNCQQYDPGDSLCDKAIDQGHSLQFAYGRKPSDRSGRVDVIFIDD